MVSYLCISTIREIGFKGDGSHFVTLTIGVSSVFNNAFNFSLPLLYRTHCKLAFCVLWPRCGHREAIELTGMGKSLVHWPFRRLIVVTVLIYWKFHIRLVCVQVRRPRPLPPPLRVVPVEKSLAAVHTLVTRADQPLLLDSPKVRIEDEKGCHE
jgi:hypothetical protein